LLLLTSGYLPVIINAKWSMKIHQSKVEKRGFSIKFLNTVIYSPIILTPLFDKIPPLLPFPKGGKIPLFGKEG